MVTSSPVAVSAFGVRARNPASYELRCGIASAQLSTDQSLAAHKPESTSERSLNFTAKTPRSPSAKGKESLGLLWRPIDAPERRASDRDWSPARVQAPMLAKAQSLRGASTLAT